MAGKVLYTAQASVTGGRHGRGRTTDGALEVDLRPPGEGGTNPEQLFAVGFAACFESAVRVIGRRERIAVDEASVDARVHLVTTEDRAYGVAVELDVSLPAVDDARAVELVRAAHAVCPYSRATRGNVDVTITANGRPVEG